jgi:hypothetical protein
VVAIQQQAAPYRPPSGYSGPGPVQRETINSSTRALVIGRTESTTWTFRGGDAVSHDRVLVSARFVGDAHDRAIWESAGRPSGTGVTHASDTYQRGFQIGNHSFSYEGLLRLPTSPVALLRLLGNDPAAAIESAQSELVPLPPRARVALFDALSTVRGVRNLGALRDPLGRPGIALAMPGGPTEPKGTPQQSRLIFDSHSDALLATENVLLGRTSIRGVGPGYPVSWTAYTASKAVPASKSPRVPTPTCAGDATEPSLAGGVVPRTGEHAYEFRVKNNFGSRCTVSGYPSVTLIHGRRSLRFVYRRGGGPYVTRRKPQPVVLAPNASAYFLLAKYRCDGKTLSAATELSVGHLGLGGSWGVELASHHVDDLDYCARYAGDTRVDRGNYVYVSPLEPTISATLP